MKGTQGLSLSLWFLFLLCLHVHIDHVVGDNSTKLKIARSSFPKGFVFGAGTSAYQVEGAVSEGGRGPSIWDTFAHIPGKIIDNSTGEVAVDQYHRYKEDVQHLKYVGLDSYRFSISWSRIFPKGSPRHGEVNEEGIAYYNNLINELINNGIKPFATLYHWDMPQALEDEYGGFRNARVVEDFTAFANVCFLAFGDRIKSWLTINEPLIHSTFGYDTGFHAPGRCSPPFGECPAGNSSTEPYIVAHNLLLAHSAAVKLYRSTYQAKQKGSIGIALVATWMEPFSKSLADRRAAQRAIEFRMGWFLDPLTKGEYPKIMRALVGARLPVFTRQQAQDLKGSFDFLGYNYYTAEFARDNPIPPDPFNSDFFLDARANVSQEFNGVSLGKPEGLDLFWSYPPGLEKVLRYTKLRYNNPPIYITETGYAGLDNGTTPLRQALNDSNAVIYHRQHLSKVLQLIRDGADIRGYLVWSLLDNFEWTFGNTGRFGLYYVNYNDGLKRYPRLSARWFKSILQN
uniref:Beta-glucosidase n=1 Tax=Araucaria cunninghamii TaxID=56994 RepID=A0A0D6QRY9_ARACU